MSVKLRLTRVGKTKQPHYRSVVAGVEEFLSKGEVA